MLWWQYSGREKCKCHGAAGSLCFCDSSCLPILVVLLSVVVLAVAAVVAFCHCCHDIVVEAKKKSQRSHSEAEEL